MDFDLTKRPKGKLLRTQSKDIPPGSIRYKNISLERDERFALYYHLQALGHIKLSTPVYEKDVTVITHISKELIRAINENSTVLQVYKKLLL